jgi:hypothetical protein
MDSSVSPTHGHRKTASGTGTTIRLYLALPQIVEVAALAKESRDVTILRARPAAAPQAAAS